jgi:hypothetical protein
MYGKSSNAWLILNHSLSSEDNAMSSKKYLGGIKTSLSLVLALTYTSFVSLTVALAADNQINIAGSPVFELADSPETTPDRVVKIQSNVDNSLVAASDHGPSAVKVTYVKGLPVISLGGYYIATVDNATAKAAATTPSLLAQKWAGALRTAMANKSSIDAYIAQLTGKATSTDTSAVTSAVASAETSPAASAVASAETSPAASAETSPAASAVASAETSFNNSSASTSESESIPSVDDMPNTAPDYARVSSRDDSQTAWQPMSAKNANAKLGRSAFQPANLTGYPQAGQQAYQGRVVYIPAGMMIPVRLATSLSSQVAKEGDVIMAKTTESIALADGVIPAESTLIGQVTAAKSGARLAQSGRLGIKFTTLRMPNGVDTPISAHITSSVGKYADKGNDTFHGENGMSKLKNSLVATAVGAGTGSALGVAVGAIASGERGLGRGAWSGAAIGGGAGLAESLFIRKGSDVNLKQGDTVKLQLDAPVTTAMN